MRPTRIVSDAYVNRGKFKTKTRLLTCDNGVTYTSIRSLAAAVDLNETTLAGRMAKNGATHRDNLKPTGTITHKKPDDTRMCQWCGELFACRPHSKQRFCGPVCGRSGRKVEVFFDSEEGCIYGNKVRGGVESITVGTWEATL